MIGFGNLGKAFVDGLIKTGAIPNKDILICANSDETIKIAEEKYGLRAYKDISKALQHSKIVIFAVKVKVFNEIVQTCDTSCFNNRIIISLMSGCSIDKIRKDLKIKDEIIRAMPNLAIESGNGIIGYTKTEDKTIIKLFQCLGFAFEINENDIEKITALSSCGLAFAAKTLDSFVSAGKALGIDESLCSQIVCRNFENAIEMGNFEKTICSVATKDGATEQGLQYLSENNFPNVIHGAVRKAYDKTMM